MAEHICRFGVNVQESARRAVHAFWDALAGQGSGDDTSLNFALGQLANLIEAQEAYWMGAVRVDEATESDPVNGWRPRAVHYLSGCSRRKSNYDAQRRILEQGEADPSIIANVKQAGRFRVHTKRNLVGDAWFESEYYRAYMEPLGIQDSIFCAMPLGENVESWWVFQRIGHPRFFFEEREVELLDYAVRSLAWFHRLVALQHGILLADKPLTRSERNVVRLLLTEKSEREIAEKLSLSPTTVHTYAARIYRKFGIRGRTGLMALWLGQNHDLGD